MFRKLLSSFIHFRQRKHIENINKGRYDNEDYSDDERLVPPSSSSEEEQEILNVKKVMRTMEELKLDREYKHAGAILRVVRPPFA